MITRDRVRILARKYQTTELNIRREYFQHVFLASFYEQSAADSIYFKGGTALRIIYQSPRFSEDLDFSTAYKDTIKIKTVIHKALELIDKEGILANLDEEKQTSGGYLAIISFTGDRQKISLQLEISLREGRKKGEVVSVVNDFLPPYVILRLNQEDLVEEKVKALFARKKPRDFFDLYFILRANLLPPQKRVILVKVLQILKGVKVNFERELKQFLPKSHWPVIRDFKNTLKREIERYI